MNDWLVYISRLVRDALGHNTIDNSVVPVIFQMSPNVASGNDRGISGLDFRVKVGSKIIQTGQTPADGRINVRLTKGRATLEILHEGTTVATYDVRERSAALEADNTINGVQRRLRMLGYQLGHGGTDKDGVTNQITKQTDFAILDFQVDEGVAFDGKVDAGTTSKLNTAVGNIP